MGYFGQPALSMRLQKVASMVSAVTGMADVGSDHGLVPLALLQAGRIQKAIAIEVAQGPFQTVAKAFQASSFGDSLEARFGSGLQPLATGEVQSIVIAGMGGGTIWSILTGNHAQAILAADAPELVLQPMDDSGLLRYFAECSGYRICADFWIKDRGLIYHCLKLCPPDAYIKFPADALQAYLALATAERMRLEYGPLFYGRGDGVALEFLQSQIGKTQKILTALGRAKGPEGILQRKKVQAYYALLLKMRSSCS